MQNLVRDRDIAEQLGMSRAKVWDLVKQGLLTPVRIPPRITRFQQSEVDALIARHIVKGEK